jgi:hypothetical protein
MHSHVSNIPVYNFEDFQIPCTGTGPINNTICSLARDFDADLWRLFCLELDRYMQVESIAGTPYHRLESLINGGYHDSYIVFQNIRLCEKLSRFRFQNFLSVSQLAEFVKYVIDSNILKVTYQNNGYYLAMSPTEYYIKLSNLFIKWYNKKWKKREVTETLQDLLSHQILGKYKIVNNKILKSSNDRYNNYQSYIGAKICTFKGQDIRLVISDAVAAEDNNSVLILKQEICEYIFTKIFNVINFRYGNSKQQTGDSSHKKIYFL